MEKTNKVIYLRVRVNCGSVLLAYALHVFHQSVSASLESPSMLRVLWPIVTVDGEVYTFVARVIVMTPGQEDKLDEGSEDVEAALRKAATNIKENLLKSYSGLKMALVTEVVTEEEL